MKTSMEKLLELLDEHGPKPARVAHRVDGKTSLRFHVDDHDDRYVFVEDSTESDDFVVTCRNFREVRAVVAGDAHDVVTMVRTELSRLGESSRTGRAPVPPSLPIGDAPDDPRAPAEVLVSFAHTSGVFLEDWHSGRLLAQEVCETLWAAAKARNIVRLVGVTRPNRESKNG